MPDPFDGAGVDDVVLRPAPSVLVEQIADETVLYHPLTEQIYVLDEVATALWSELAEGTRLTTLCEALAERFGVNAARVATDIEAPLGGLIESGLLLVSPAG